MSNAQFAESNENFRLCCKATGIEPTARQASRWLNKKGKARQARAEAVRQLTVKVKQIQAHGQELKELRKTAQDQKEVENLTRQLQKNSAEYVYVKGQLDSLVGNP